jgi:hypothetical protein
MHLALASEAPSDDVIAALKAAGCSMVAKNAMGLTCAEVEGIRSELAADAAAKAQQIKGDVKERRDKKKEEKMADLRDFLETEAELDAPSIEALLAAGHIGSIDALVKLCDSDDRLRKVVKVPKVAKRLQAAVRLSMFEQLFSCVCECVFRCAVTLRAAAATTTWRGRWCRRRAAEWAAPSCA